MYKATDLPSCSSGGVQRSLHGFLTIPSKKVKAAVWTCIHWCAVLSQRKKKKDYENSSKELVTDPTVFYTKHTSVSGNIRR